ncbi:phage tail assembly chaperone [Tindallia californiensis]|uniref:Phage XkdN-like tail assembly chaperone protein, TAC n=1 Tax=Tindallia californiensis TaxID=159292 RepID=A0A1H3R255_9FIRM|nr:hypothetical protein [Tindallia californiensis]SDZ19381.1 Phage XkdN-like tail assembly chaperone protein, TAC [Tindallia californiensis]
MKKVTINDLLEKKDVLKNKKHRKQNIYVPSLDGKIVIQEPSREICAEALEMANDGDVYRSDAHVVYNCVVDPNIKDESLQKEMGCVEPTDIVDILFNAGEVASISGHCMEMAGYGSGIKKLDDELKN